MSGMLPVVVLGIILLLAGYVVYRSIMDERHGQPGGADPPGPDLPVPDPSVADPSAPDLQVPDSALPRWPGDAGSGVPPEHPETVHPDPPAPERSASDPEAERSASGSEAGAAEVSGPLGEQHDGGPAVRGKGRPRRRRTDRADADPALADHVGKLREAVDAHLISTDEAVASLIRSSGGALDDGGARAILAETTQPSPRGSAG